MQAATAGDQYSWTLTQQDGVTPLSLTGATHAEVAIAGPFPTALAAEAAGMSSGVVTPATLSNSPPTASWVTTLAANNSATQTTFPLGGYYLGQIAIFYASGAVAKSETFVLDLMDSII